MAAPVLLSSVPAQTPYVQYVATSNQTVFPYPFEAQQDADITVVANGVTLATDVGYTVSGLGASGGGNITFNAGRTAGDIITLYRNIAISRVTQLPQNGTFFASTFNNEFNRAYLIMQQLQQNSAFYLQIPNTNVNAGLATTKLLPANYANKYLAFDSNGNPTPAVLTSSGSLTPGIIGGLIYPQTAAEIAAGATPTNFAYPADPYVDPRRYGADPTGVVISTTAVQTAINVAYNAKGVVWIGNGCNYLCGALSLTVTGNQNNDGIRIMGSSIIGSSITCSGNPSALLTITGNTPTGNPSPVPVVLENFALMGPGGVSPTPDGLLLQGLAYWTLRNLTVQGFNHNIYLNSALTGTIENCGLFVGSYGIYARQDGAGSGNNLVKIRDCVIDSMTQWGIDYGAGDRVKIEACDFEGNGTSGNTSTGALIIRSTVNFATGYASFDLDGVWFESNLGQTMHVENTSHLCLAIRNTVWYADESSRTLLIDGAESVSIEDSIAPSGAGSIWNITCTKAHFKNCVVGTLTDSAIVWPTYINVVAGSGLISGRNDTFTATLTGCTTSPTASVTVIQQGADVTLQIPGLNATSNSTACTITGLPSKYQPATRQNVFVAVNDNGVTAVCPADLVPSSGTITFDRTFTSSGTKGLQNGSVIRYRLTP